MNTCIRRYPRALTLTAMQLVVAAGALAGSDFNGDGVQDLAVGVPNESNGNVGGGAVQVFYGSPNNGIQLTLPVDQVWHQDSPLVDGACEFADHFGKVIATGDFDGDGFDDIAISSPDEDIDIDGDGFGQASNIGMVSVLYGSNAGLHASTDEVFVYGRDGLGGTLKFQQPDMQFGSALAAGDFDGDQFCDLAIGTPYDKVNGRANAGSVQLLKGTATGLVPWKYLHQDSPGILGQCEVGDTFGAALAATDFGGDGRADLAVGVPFEDVVINGFNETDCGMVQVVYGTAQGLTDIDETWNQGENGLRGKTGSNERFGSALAAARVSGRACLAATVASDGDSPSRSGSVVIFLDNILTHRLTSAGNRLVHFGVISPFGAPASTDQFGFSLTMADFGRNFEKAPPKLDLAIGAPGAASASPQGGQFANSGAVFILYDLTLDPSDANTERFGQGVVSGIQDQPELGDRFGASLAAANFGRSALADLAVGVPNEDNTLDQNGLPRLDGKGAIHVLYSAGTTGIDSANSQFFTQNTLNAEEDSESSDNFGAALGASN